MEENHPCFLSIMSSSPNVQLMEGGFPDYQQWLYYMASRLRAAIIHCRDKPVHPHFLPCLRHDLVSPCIILGLCETQDHKSLAYVVLTIGTAVSACPHCPRIIGHISRALVRLNLETGGVDRLDSATLESMRMLPCHEAGGDKLLEEYQWAWWLQLDESERRPPRLNLIDCVNAFKHDEWQLGGQPKPIQPPPPIGLEDARRFLTTWQGWMADFIDQHVDGMYRVRDKIIEDGFPPPEESSPRALLKEYQQKCSTEMDV